MCMWDLQERCLGTFCDSCAMPREAGPPEFDDLSITLQTLIMGGFNKHSG